MLETVYLNNCQRSLKKCIKRGKDIVKLENLVDMLARHEPLPARYRDHKLTGDFEGCRECHIEPDWLLIYRVQAGSLLLGRKGSHADLFG